MLLLRSEYFFYKVIYIIEGGILVFWNQILFLRKHTNSILTFHHFFFLTKNNLFISPQNNLRRLLIAGMTDWGHQIQTAFHCCPSGTPRGLFHIEHGVSSHPHLSLWEAENQEPGETKPCKRYSGSCINDFLNLTVQSLITGLQLITREAY